MTVDLDGTMARTGHPTPRYSKHCGPRAAGLRLVLVTGRIMAELKYDLPGLVGEFDAVVVENGKPPVRGPPASPTACRGRSSVLAGRCAHPAIRLASASAHAG